MNKSKLPHALCEQCTLIDCALVPPKAPANPVLIIIGEAPSIMDAEHGEPFAGPGGQILKYAFEQTDTDMNLVHKTNMVSCKTPSNREPTSDEIQACMPRLLNEIKDLNAPVIALGKVANESLEMSEYSRGAIFDWYGHRATHTYHPDYILRKPSDSIYFMSDIRKFLSAPIARNPKWEDPDVVHIQNAEELYEILEGVADDTWVAFDLETDNVKWYESLDGTPPDPILMLQIAWEDDFGIVLDDEMLYDVPATREILNAFFKRVKTTAHNGKFDQIFLLSHIGVDVHLDFDTMLAHGILDENAKHGLKELTSYYFGIEDYEARLIKQYLPNRNDRYSKIPFDKLAKYGVIDVIMTLQFRKMFYNKLVAQGRLEWPFNNIIMRAANRFAKIEYRGTKIDVPYLQLVQKQLEHEMLETANEIRHIANWPDLNVNSSQQVAVLIYDMLKMPAPKSRKLPPRSTNHEVLEALEGRHPVIDLILKHRRIAKMKGSYADNLIEALDVNGRVHANFQIIGTEVGRLAAKNPALQTIPRAESEKDGKGMYGRMIRGAFTAEPGKMLLVVDYSQAELRVAAVLADEPFLIDVYENGRDLHSEVAKAMYGEGYTKEQRVMCKMFNFSYLYGGSEYSFAKDAGLNINVAKEFVQKYNRVMPELAAYRKSQFQKMNEQGFVQSPFGRRRNFEIITKVNMDEAQKSCVHAPIAGTASDLTLMVACQLIEEGFDVVLTVHDSVVLEVDAHEAEAIGKYVAELMCSVGSQYLPQVKWKSDPEVRSRWAEPPKELLLQLS